MKTALVLVHIDSIHALRDLAGDGEADKVLLNIWSLVAKRDYEELVVVSQYWVGVGISADNHDIRLLRDEATKIIKFDELTQGWPAFIRRLSQYLGKHGIERVVVAGVWFDPKNKVGCVNETAKGLIENGFQVKIDKSACGIDRGY